MLVEPKCWQRKCKHFRGCMQPDGTEQTERWVCAAFPEIIPAEIVSGDNLHAEPLPEQLNDIVYEEASEDEWPPPLEVEDENVT